VRILHLASWRSQGIIRPLACASGVAGADLKKRSRLQACAEYGKLRGSLSLARRHWQYSSNKFHYIAFAVEHLVGGILPQQLTAERARNWPTRPRRSMM
jgi:hypothetical protein